MDLDKFYGDVISIKKFAYTHDLRISEVIELLKLEQEKNKNKHLEEIEYTLDRLSSDIDEIRREKRDNEDLSKIETSIYSVTTAIEKLENNY